MRNCDKNEIQSTQLQFSGQRTLGIRKHCGAHNFLIFLHLDKRGIRLCWCLFFWVRNSSKWRIFFGDACSDGQSNFGWFGRQRDCLAKSNHSEHCVDYSYSLCLYTSRTFGELRKNFVRSVCAFCLCLFSLLVSRRQRTATFAKIRLGIRDSDNCYSAFVMSTHSIWNAFALFRFAKILFGKILF